ncbi:MAG: hypothetical protein M1828_003791 [Chrysothrix sp. TS-e1954]|nr:MAG: hypothetical protein M1828_003791 [Chrysothrix sp. TS-e1954]
MPSKSLNKVQKHINKKKGKRPVLHERSRDAQKLRQALSRSDRVNSHALVTSKTQLPFVERIAFFQQEVSQRGKEPFTPEEIHKSIQNYIGRHDENLEQLQAERRPGRPPTKQQEVLQQRKQSEKGEYLSGLWMPLMTDTKNLEALEEWNQEWTALGTMKYCRVTEAGAITSSAFPPRGLS